MPAKIRTSRGWGGDVGASWWQNFVPFEEDIAASLDRLQWEIYRNGAYFHEEPLPEYAMSEAEFIASIGGLEDDADGRKAFLYDDWKAAQDREPVTSPGTLLASQPETGTHSAIDLYLGVSQMPEMFTASPLSVAQFARGVRHDDAKPSVGRGLARVRAADA